MVIKQQLQVANMRSDRGHLCFQDKDYVPVCNGLQLAPLIFMFFSFVIHR